MINEKHTGLLRVLLWALVALYTSSLPYVIFVYRAIEKHFSVAVAGKIPIVIIIFFGIAYIVFILLTKKITNRIGFIVLCPFIVYAIISLEPNPNKHIHIPEYVLMCWILFEALSIDYNGKGIFILLFICSSMLGIIDELEQGIHPNRFYGWSDMCINSASTIIGILTIMGIRKRQAGDWAWIGHLKKLKGSIGLLMFGAIGAVLLCIYLFYVKENKTFWGVYPLWLLGWNNLFVSLGVAMVFYQWHRLRKKEHRRIEEKELNIKAKVVITAHLWVLSSLVILIVMHAIVMFIAISGWEFM
ncbi:VanZ family protein [bacterium]|nr:VanZ family protein [bacterium]